MLVALRFDSRALVLTGNCFDNCGLHACVIFIYLKISVSGTQDRMISSGTEQNASIDNVLD